MIRARGDMWLLRTIPPALGLVLIGIGEAVAGNVYVQIQCGNPPELERTSHEARTSGFSIEELEPEWGWQTPRRGVIADLTIDGRKLTLADGEIHKGFVETAELGRVFFFLADDRGDPGYFLVIRPETRDELAAQ